MTVGWGRMHTARRSQVARAGPCFTSEDSGQSSSYATFCLRRRIVRYAPTPAITRPHAAREAGSGTPAPGTSAVSIVGATLFEVCDGKSPVVVPLAVRFEL